MQGYDLAIVGAGILGLAHELAAVRRGLRVVVLDRDAQANGASIRNFGFVVVTGQAPGAALTRAARTRDVWEQVAPQAGITVQHRGTLLVAHPPEAMALLEAFAPTSDARLLTPRALAALQPQIDGSAMQGALHSERELRVDSVQAIPRLTAWLAGQGVHFRFSTAVTAIDPPHLHTSAGPIRAARIVVCPGDDLTGLYADRIAARAVTRCKLQMLRLADPGFRLAAGVMTDLSLLRYGGFASLPQAAALRARLKAEQPEHLANGVHMIAVQGADGSLVVGDSHHYGPTPDPFASESVDALILSEFHAVFGPRAPRITQRWTGTYSSSPVSAFCDAPHPDVRLVMVTSGTGASTGFALAEETLDGWGA